MPPKPPSSSPVFQVAAQRAAGPRAWSANDRIRLLEAIFRGTNDAVAVIDPNGFYLEQNEAHARLIGYSPDELRGKTPALDLGDEAFRQVAQTLAKEGEFRGELVSRTKDGREVPVELAAFAVRDSAGNVLAYVGVKRAITDRTRAEQDLRRVNEELEGRVQQRTLDLENVVRERESFSYSVSHDLRTPLRTIRGFSSILAEDYGDKLDEKGHQYLGFIQGATTRMAEIIDDLLKLSQITRSEMNRRPVDLTAIAQGVADRLAEANADRKIHVVISPRLTADADPHLIRVVLENLLGNAWKFTQRTLEARIEFGAESEGPNRRYFVRDNGAGFDMAYMDRLFKPFQRLHSTRDFPGTGIGLATVARIIERHGGRVDAEGAPGKGATFYFSL